MSNFLRCQNVQFAIIPSLCLSLSLSLSLFLFHYLSLSLSLPLSYLLTKTHAPKKTAEFIQHKPLWKKKRSAERSTQCTCRRGMGGRWTRACAGRHRCGWMTRSRNTRSSNIEFFEFSWLLQMQCNAVCLKSEEETAAINVQE